MSTATATRERPILFSAPMVRAILDGRKTQTRRIIKKPGADVVGRDANGELSNDVPRAMPDWQKQVHIEKCPYGQVGDNLWVRESWAELDDHYGAPCMVYRADRQACHIGLTEARGEHLCGDWHEYDVDVSDKFKPSIHMPRWASRITLEITGVRVERLQDISEDDAMAEGIRFHEASRLYGEGRCFGTAKGAFAALWDEINGEGSWAKSPWVWAISFRRIQP